MSSNSPTDSPSIGKRLIGRRILVRAAFVCALLATLIVAFFLVERVRGQAAWKRYRDDAVARGVKLNLVEYVPPPVPDERNFAAIPVFQDAFQKPQPPNPFALPEAAGSKQARSHSVAKGLRIDMSGWQKFFVAQKVLPSAGDSAAGDVLKALERYAPQMEQLRVAGARPDCRFPVRYEDGFAAALPHLSLMMSASRLYTLRLAAHLALGDSPGAYEDFRESLRLYTATQREPTLIAGLVRLGVLAMLENGVWGGIAGHQWAAPELEKIGADLAAVRLMDDYALGLGSERGFCNLVHDQLVQEGTSKLPSMVEGAPGDGGFFGPFLAHYPVGWLRLNQTRANRYFDEMLTRVSQEPPRIFTDRLVSSWPREMSKVGTFERLRYRLFFLLAPALSEVESSYAYGQTLLDETRLGCALERHRLSQGGLPSSLELLSPAFISTLPRDVMTGEPLHYRKTGEDGYTLYSVGWNRTDDDGKSEPNVNAAKQQADWVWAVPAKQAGS